MRVDHRAPAQATRGAAGPAAGRRTAGGFSVAGPSGGSSASAPAAATTLAGLDAVLLLQGDTDSPAERRRRSATRGRDLLDGLDRLKAALLSGRVGASDLAAIAGRLSERAALSGDPRLDDLVAQIELRAAVEMAKLQAARGA